MNERLEQLKAEKARLEQSLAEVNYLIEGYEKSIKDQEKNESDKQIDSEHS